MSVVKVNRLQLGQSATPNFNISLGPPAVPDGGFGIWRGNADALGTQLMAIGTDGLMYAGANPATGARSTALATMQKFADEFLHSHAVPGYQRLPSGLIIQWGQGVLPASGGYQSTVVVTYPVAFSTANAYCVLANAIDQANSSSFLYPTIGFPTILQNQATAVGDTHLAAVFNKTTLFRWMAIGR